MSFSYPRSGLTTLFVLGLVKNKAESIAKFLRTEAKLSKTIIGTFCTTRHVSLRGFSYYGYRCVLVVPSLLFCTVSGKVLHMSSSRESLCTRGRGVHRIARGGEPYRAQGIH